VDEQGCLTISVVVVGEGFDQVDTAEGHGLVNMRDRIESVGGALTVTSRLGLGTRVAVRLPTAAHGAAPRSVL
jgi:signal transduction histidine kinase